MKSDKDALAVGEDGFLGPFASEGDKGVLLAAPFAVEGYVELELTAPRRLHLPADLMQSLWRG
jgi:hypothetical protein